MKDLGLGRGRGLNSLVLGTRAASRPMIRLSWPATVPIEAEQPANEG